MVEKLVEYYEDVRDNYAEDVEKHEDRFKLYVPRYLKILREPDIRITCLDEKELFRIAFYIEDMTEQNSLNDDFHFGKWMLENLKRKPDFYTKYFRHKPALAITPTVDVKKGEILPDLTNGDETSANIWSQNPADITVLSDTVNSINEEEDLPEDYKSQYLIETSMTDTIIAIQKQKQAEIQVAFEKIVEDILHINLYDKQSLMAQLAELHIYKQLILGIFDMLSIETAVTSFDLGVSHKKISFKKGNSFSLEEIKKGFMQANVKIKELKDLEDANNSWRHKETDYENRLRQFNVRYTEIYSRLEQIQMELEVAKSKPKIEDAKLLYLYIAWRENEELYYLASNNMELNEAGFYLVSSLYKTKNRKDAIKFKSRKHATDQLTRVDKNYKNINRKAGISLTGHIHNAIFIMVTETEIPKVFVKPKPAIGQNSEE